MSEIVVSGIIEAGRLSDFAETFASKAVGMDQPLVHEAKLHFDEDGVRVICVDAANVAMLGPCQLHPRAFEHYEPTGSVTIAIDLTKLINRLGPADYSQPVEFEIDMETRHFRLSYGAAETTIAMIDPESVRNEPDVPGLDLPNMVTLTGEKLSDAIDVVDMVSDHIDVLGDVDGRCVVFRGRGDTDDATVTYSDEDVLDSDVVENHESKFSIDYMRALAKPIPDDAEVTIHFGDEFPIRMGWSMFDNAFDVTQTLAPRVQPH